MRDWGSLVFSNDKFLMELSTVTTVKGCRDHASFTATPK